MTKTVVGHDVNPKAMKSRWLMGTVAERILVLEQVSARFKLGTAQFTLPRSRNVVRIADAQTKAIAPVRDFYLLALKDDVAEENNQQK